MRHHEKVILEKKYLNKDCIATFAYRPIEDLKRIDKKKLEKAMSLCADNHIVRMRNEKT